MESVNENDVMVTIEDAAEELSTTGLRLLMLLREGTLKGLHHQGVWMITRESLEHLKQTGLSAPTKKGCASSCQASTCGCH
jgi:hypothetical protein